MGTGIAVVLLLAVLVWDLATIRRLAAVGQELSQVSFRVSMLALEQDRLLNRMDEFIRKYSVTGDEAYDERLSELEEAFAERLAELSALRLSEEERLEAGTLSSLWAGYWRAAVAFQDAPLAGSVVDRDRLEALLARLDVLQRQVRKLDEVAQSRVAEEARRSVEVSRRAERLSWAVVGVAMVVSLLILWLTVRSIQRPLKRLAAGTRAVADGDFSVRLDSSAKDEFGRLAESFNQMVHRLAELDQVKKDFLSHVSHELKTPLVSMQETTELLLEEIPGPLNDRQQRFLALNLESSLRLSTMITRLLDLSRLEAGVMEYELLAHDLGDVVRAAVSGFEARSRELEVGIELNVPEHRIAVDCDRDRIIQVVGNLVDNALKFSSTGETIEVSVHPLLAASSNRGPAFVEVKDRGPGIPDEDKERVFERFYQVRRGRSEGGGKGVGLGLAICREIIEAHGGGVSVRDGENGGSIFSFNLPAAEVMRGSGDG
jgi:signal transduction histidine kinase